MHLNVVVAKVIVHIKAVGAANSREQCAGTPKMKLFSVAGTAVANAAGACWSRRKQEEEEQKKRRRWWRHD